MSVSASDWLGAVSGQLLRNAVANCDRSSITRGVGDRDIASSCTGCKTSRATLIDRQQVQADQS